MFYAPWCPKIRRGSKIGPGGKIETAGFYFLGVAMPGGGKGIPMAAISPPKSNLREFSAFREVPVLLFVDLLLLLRIERPVLCLLLGGGRDRSAGAEGRDARNSGHTRPLSLRGFSRASFRSSGVLASVGRMAVCADASADSSKYPLSTALKYAAYFGRNSHPRDSSGDGLPHLADGNDGKVAR